MQCLTKKVSQLRTKMAVGGFVWTMPKDFSSLLGCVGCRDRRMGVISLQIEETSSQSRIRWKILSGILPHKGQAMLTLCYLLYEYWV